MSSVGIKGSRLTTREEPEITAVPMSGAQREAVEPEGQTVADDNAENTELFKKLLQNPETMALLKTLAKNM